MMMVTVRRLLLLAMLAMASAQTVAAQAADKPVVVKIRAFSAEKTEALGEAMYIQDQAAWRATDLMMAAKPDLNGVFGWIAAPYAGGQRVRFLKGTPQDARAVYEVVFAGKTKPAFLPATDPALTGDEAAQLHALETAKASGVNSCGSRPPNHIEIRDPDTGEWLVWLLSPWTEKDGIAMGGHTRITVSADGSTLLRKEAMSMSCLGMKPPPESGGQHAMMYVTQLVADTPLETHVFNSLQAHVGIAVGMPDETVWLVNGREITNMGKLADLKKSKR